MTKKIILWICILILLIGTAFAFTPHRSTELNAYWLLNDTTDSGPNGYTLNANKVQMIDASLCGDISYPCMNTTDEDTYYNRSGMATLGDVDMTWGLWMYLENSSQTYATIQTFRDDVSRNYEHHFDVENDSDFNYKYGNDPPNLDYNRKNNIPGLWNNATSGWTYLTITYSATDDNFTYYMNGNKMISVINATLTSKTEELVFGNGYNQNEARVHNKFQHLGWWNATFTDAEVSALYNTFTIPTVTDAINISAGQPANNTQFDYANMNFNCTVNATNSFSSYLYINDVLNQSGSHSSGTEVLVSYNVTLGEGTWTYYIQVNDSSTQENTTNNTFFVDTVQPAMTWNTPTTTNTSVVFNSSIANITLTDNNLYSYQYNVTTYAGVMLYNFSDYSLTGYTVYNITDTTNVSNLSGVHLAVVRAADGHTAKAISDFGVIETNNELQFAKDSENIRIYIANKIATDKYWAQKGTDRYYVNFETKASVSSETFIVESDNYINIIDSDYAGHLISGNKWIDFVTSNLKRVDVVRISDKKVMVTVEKTKPSNLWYFSSIGELNTNLESKQFYVIGSTETYSANLLRGQTGTFILELTTNSSWITDMNATLMYNNTAYTPTKASTASAYTFTATAPTPAVSSNANISFYWTFDADTNSFTTDLQTQEVDVPAIDNCTTYSTTFANFTLRNELNSTILTGDLDAYWNFTVGTYTNTYNISMDGRTSFAFCTDPAWANFTSIAYLQYSSTGYEARDYIQTAFRVDNTTEQVNLYSLLTGASTAVTVHTKDDGDNDLSNILVEVYRWDIPTDTSILVETELTNSEGNAIVNVVQGSEYYSFRLYQDGELALQTSPFKIFDTTLEFTLSSQETTRLGEWLQLQGITTSLSYSNSTNIVSLTFADATNISPSICLTVADLNQTYTNTCSGALNGVLNYTITTMNRTYTAQARAQGTSSGNYYILETMEIDTRTDWRVMGTSLSLILAFLVVLVVGLLFTTNPSMGIVGTTVAVIALYFFGILPLSFGSIAGLCVVAAILLMLVNRRAE